jgi:hypothetical protein
MSGGGVPIGGGAPPSGRSDLHAVGGSPTDSELVTFIIEVHLSALSRVEGWTAASRRLLQEEFLASAGQASQQPAGLAQPRQDLVAVMSHLPHLFPSGAGVAEIAE